MGTKKLTNVDYSESMDSVFVNDDKKVRQVKKSNLVKLLGMEMSNGVVFKGKDTTSNIIAKEQPSVGDKWFSTDENVYYMYSSNGWVNVGSGEDYSNIMSEFNELKGDLEQLKQNGGGTGIGLSTDAIDKLEEVGNYLAYTAADGGSKWTELIAILRGASGGDIGGGDSGETGTLQSISATYTGGEVATGTDLTALKGISVKATYSDGTTKTVTGYKLTGEILEGENIITVTYGGKTTTFIVTGVVETGGGDTTAELPIDGLQAYFDLRNCPKTVAEHTTAYSLDATQGDGMLYSWYSSDEGNEYGISLSTSIYSDVTNANNTYDFGNEFTFAIKSYSTAYNGVGYPSGYGSPTNIGLINVVAKYNTSDGTGSTSGVLAEGKAEGYKTYIVVADSVKVSIYVNENLITTFNSSDYEDFVSWFSTFTTTRAQSSSDLFTAIALYNKALSGVEVVELESFFKTLEVA